MRTSVEYTKQKVLFFAENPCPVTAVEHIYEWTEAERSQNRADAKVGIFPRDEPDADRDQNDQDAESIRDNTVDKVRRLEVIGHAERQIVIWCNAEVGSLIHGKTKCQYNQRNQHVNQLIEKALSGSVAYGSLQQDGGILYDITQKTHVNDGTKAKIGTAPDQLDDE